MLRLLVQVRRDERAVVQRRHAVELGAGTHVAGSGGAQKRLRAALTEVTRIVGRRVCGSATCTAQIGGEWSSMAFRVGNVQGR